MTESKIRKPRRLRRMRCVAASSPKSMPAFSRWRGQDASGISPHDRSARRRQGAGSDRGLRRERSIRPAIAEAKQHRIIAPRHLALGTPRRVHDLFRGVFPGGENTLGVSDWRGLAFRARRCELSRIMCRLPQPGRCACCRRSSSLAEGTRHRRLAPAVRAEPACRFRGLARRRHRCHRLPSR